MALRPSVTMQNMDLDHDEYWESANDTDETVFVLSEVGAAKVAEYLGGNWIVSELEVSGADYEFETTNSNSAYWRRVSVGKKIRGVIYEGTDNYGLYFLYSTKDGVHLTIYDKIRNRRADIFGSSARSDYNTITNLVASRRIPMIYVSPTLFSMGGNPDSFTTMNNKRGIVISIGVEEITNHEALFIIDKSYASAYWCRWYNLTDNVQYSGTSTVVWATNFSQFIVLMQFKLTNLINYNFPKLYSPVYFPTNSANQVKKVGEIYVNNHGYDMGTANNFNYSFMPMIDVTEALES